MLPVTFICQTSFIPACIKSDLWVENPSFRGSVQKNCALRWAFRPIKRDITQLTLPLANKFCRWLHSSSFSTASQKVCMSDDANFSTRHGIDAISFSISGNIRLMKLSILFNDGSKMIWKINTHFNCDIRVKEPLWVQSSMAVEQEPYHICSIQ